MKCKFLQAFVFIFLVGPVPLACYRVDMPSKNVPVDTVYEYDPAADTWSKKAPIPSPRMCSLVQACSQRIYLMGGYQPGADGLMAPGPFMDVYDPALNTWSTGTSIFHSGVYTTIASHCAIATKIYVAGGYTQETWLRAYDIVEDTWMLKADSPEPVIEASRFVIDDDIFFVDAYCLRYDTETDTWSECADPPQISNPGKGILNGRIYMVGGEVPDEGICLSTIYEYATDTGAWTPRSDMPTARCRPAVVGAGGKVYVLGGYGEAGVPLYVVEEYNPATDEWTAKTDAVMGPGYDAFVIGGKIYLVSPSGEVAQYEPASDTWTTKARVRLSSSYPGRCVQVGEKIYAIGGYVRVDR